MTIATQQKNIPPEVFSNPAYFGKHVVVIDGEVHMANTGDEAVRILEEIRKEHPDKKPILAYIPKDEMLILFICLRSLVVNNSLKRFPYFLKIT